MMSKKLFSLLLLSIVVLMPNAWASNPFSAKSKVAIWQSRTKQAPSGQRLASHATGDVCQAFIAVRDNSTLEAMRGMGIIVNGEFNGFVTAQVPMDALGALASLEGISHISLGNHIHLCNDSARFMTNVDPLHAGADYVVPYKGRGVIVGMVDVGVDFNHINFWDATGKTRVRAVYMPCDTTGEPPVVDGLTMPGSCYETPEQIAQLTTDDTDSSHGTHTTGTAAGSYLDNGWYGMAPEADIAVCCMPSNQLTDVNIANGVKYLFDYADRVGKPCVINMSIGTNEGPNNGTSFLCRTFTSLAAPGHIMVLSAGNDGNNPICFHKTIQGEGDTVSTLIRGYSGAAQVMGYVSMWSDRSQEHCTRLVVVDRNTNEVKYATPYVNYLPEDSVFTLSSETDSVFALYFTGDVEFANAQEACYMADGTLLDETRFHSFWSFDATRTAKNYSIGLQYVADTQVELAGWSTSYGHFYSYDLDGFSDGTTSGSISDLATTDDVISVGSYNSRQTMPLQDGTIYTQRKSTPNEISYFSSYGPDENGISRPDVCALGSVLLSSANRYHESTNTSRWQPPVIVDGVEYPYCPYYGTSMSTPVVTGVIALMLQLDPSLDATAVREVLNNTSNRDSYVESGVAEQWGTGKLDATAAVNYVIENRLLMGDVDKDGQLTISDITLIIDIILGNAEAYDASTMTRADLNWDHEITISDVTELIDILLK